MLGLPSFRRSPSTGRALAAAALLAISLSPDPAQAYCRTSACEGHPEGWKVCTPAEPDDCGVVLYRTRPRVTYSIQEDASDQVSFEQTRTLVRQAFDTWMAADCGGGQPPRVEVIEADPAVCDKHEYNQDRGNANLIVYRDDVWLFDHAKIAVTTVTHNIETGEIYDADLEINATTDYTFTTDGSGTGIDLLSVLTHETGHFLGLAHSRADGATMMEAYPGDPNTLRTLTDDDVAGICAVYPPGAIADGCDATPRHGFSTLCAADQPGPADEPDVDPDDCCCPGGDPCIQGVCQPGGCGCRVGSGEGEVGWGAVAVGLVVVARRRRRR